MDLEKGISLSFSASMCPSAWKDGDRHYRIQNMIFIYN